MLFVVVFLIVVLLVVVIDHRICVGGLEQDLRTYLADVKRAEELIEDPSMKVHYRAVLTTLSMIYSKYFPLKEPNG